MTLLIAIFIKQKYARVDQQMRRNVVFQHGCADFFTEVGTQSFIMGMAYTKEEGKNFKLVKEEGKQVLLTNL